MDGVKGAGYRPSMTSGNNGEIFQSPVRRQPREELPPADTVDPVVEAYKRDVDRTLLRQNLGRSLDQRVAQAAAAAQAVGRWRQAQLVTAAMAH